MRLIDADAVIPIIEMGEMNTYDDLGMARNGGIEFAIDRINQMPTIEPKKGKWIQFDFPWYQCSVCGAVRENKTFMENYCPNCGADMRGEGCDSEA